jgi:hypothetical protein
MTWLPARFWALAACVAAAASCSDGDPTECTQLAPSEAVLVVSEANATIRDVVEGGDVPLIRPIQGGQILLVGARVRSGRDCDYRSVGRIRDLTTEGVHGSDERTLELAVQPDGWAVPAQGFLPLLNVPVCPSAATPTRVDDTLQRLEVSLETRSGIHVIDLAATVRPMCSNADCMTDCGPI